MEIRNLNTFLQVASLKNFTQAGRLLGYSQSNISAQIQQLEREVGVPLFNRIGRQVTLTQQGEELIPYARSIVSTALHMENFLKSKENLGGTIHIGMVESLYEKLFETVILPYHTAYPHVNVELVVDATETLKEDLRQGILDFACIIAEPLNEAYWQIWHSQTAPIVIIANPSNHLASRDQLLLSDLKEEEFILMESTAPYIVDFQNCVSAKNIRLAPFLTLQSSATAVHLVSQENFISILPLYAVIKEVQQNKVVILPAQDFQENQAIQLILHPNKAITPQIEGFLTELRQAMNSQASFNQLF